MNDFLLAVLIFSLTIFAGLRLWWIYRRGLGQLFWQTPRAKHFYVGAAIVFVLAALSLFLNVRSWPLLLTIPAIYVLLAFTAVKVDERGIMANAVFARWQDIVRLHHDEPGGFVLVSTKHSWRKIKLYVPPEKFNAFKKMLAAKGMALSPAQAGRAEEFIA
jgi:hypothetical protein